LLGLWVIVGRVSVNNGFGVPNAMVSVFIPLDDVDKKMIEIRGLPIHVTSDKDENGVDTYTKEVVQTYVLVTLSQQKGSFRNDQLGYVYEKYYKFTTTTMLVIS
jgi:hypothetical protein